MTEEALTDLQAVRFARGIRGNRSAVAAVHDRIAAQAGPDIADFKTVALGISDPVAALAAALMQASNAKPPWHKAFLSELAEMRLIDLKDELAAGAPAEAVMELVLQSGDDAPFEPQGFDATVAGTMDAASLIGAQNQAARRLCLIEVETAPGNKMQGTGFLIGPHTVLTNWHVMDHVIDPKSGTAVAGSADRISIRFETLSNNQGRTCRVAEDWLVAYSPFARTPLDRRPRTVSPDGTELDYCAIRVLGAPGRERGWYDLAKTGQLNRDTDLFCVFQHPAAFPQRVAFGTANRDEKNDDYLHHWAWTTGGSSGALCLDHSLTPIAIHHAAVNKKGKKDGMGAADPRYDQVKVLRLTKEPKGVIGRAGTLAKLRMMAAGKDRPILLVSGKELGGKSFTKDLLKEILNDGSGRAIELSATALPASVPKLARMILEKAGLPEDRITAALKRTAQETTANATVADIAKNIWQGLLQLATASNVQPFTFWLVIDELERVKLPKIKSRDLLTKLYQDLAQYNKENEPSVLCVVLIGLEGTLESVDPMLISIDPLPDPQHLVEAEVEDCLAGVMVEAGVMPMLGEPRRHRDLILGASRALVANGAKADADGNRIHTPLSALSALVSTIYLGAVETWKKV